jgi:excisionase family DNA binding protein
MTTASLEIAPDRTQLLTMKEASQRLRISRSTLYDLIHRQRLETVKIGRRRLVPPEALAKLITNLREGPM